MSFLKKKKQKVCFILGLGLSLANAHGPELKRFLRSFFQKATI
jgi:hypothetical protein